MSKRTNRKPSMGDVAQAVGVSKTTISRYLHGEFGYMSPETKTRIETVIRELGYRPNRMAQGLKATVSNQIGVTIADIGNPFSSLLLKGIEQECRARDIHVLVSDANNESARERANVESLLDAQVDGLIVNTVGANGDWLTAYCTGVGHKPMVMLDRFVQPLVCDAVVTDNHNAAFVMLDHLIERGYDYVAFVVRPGEGISTREMRREAVEQYFLDRALQGEVVVYREGTDELARRIEMLGEAHRDARLCLFANNDETMRDVIEALPASMAGRTGLCAFASAYWAKYTGAGVTCLDQDPVVMGRRAAARLLARVYDGYDGPYELEEISATLHPFASTATR